jgi:hypothetical protein
MPKFWRLIGKRPLPLIHLLSDVHLETGPYLIPPELDFDILVAAGDIGPVAQAIEWLESLGKPVVYVLGNHEYWGQEYSNVLSQAKSAAIGTQVHVLERTSAVIQGVRFLGATLWTDFGGWHADLVRMAISQMRDYSEISARRWYETKSNLAWFRHHCKIVGMRPEFTENLILDGRFHPAIVYQLHLRTVAWLKYALRRPFAGPTVVVTHHAPTHDSLRAYGFPERLLAPEHWGYRDDSMVRVAGYASRLNTLLKHHSETIDFWAHGHLHAGFDVLSEGVRVVCNPRGYAEKPFDEQSARAFALFGLPVSEEDILRSQALHREQPNRGDAPDFDDALVIDLESGLERPISHAIEAPLATLREVMEDAIDLVGHLKHTRNPLRKYLIRCLDQDMHAFNETLDDLMAGIRPAFTKFSAYVLAEPSRPWGPIHDEGDVLNAYVRAIESMDEWCVLVQGLPGLAQARLIEWVQVSRGILTMLNEAGIEASIARLPAAVLRRPDRLKHRVIVNDDEALRDEWEPKLDKAFDGGIPRRHLIWLQELSDIPKDRRVRLLTMKELDKFGQENATEV